MPSRGGSVFRKAAGGNIDYPIFEHDRPWGYVSRFLKLAAGRRNGFVPALIDWISKIPTKAKVQGCVGLRISVKEKRMVQVGFKSPSVENQH